MTTIASRDTEAPTAPAAGASKSSVNPNTPNRIMDVQSMSTSTSSPLSPTEAARIARGLTALQNWLLRRIVAAGGTWNSLESPFAELDGGGQAVAALKRRGLIRTTAFHKILTPAGGQVAALLPPLDERVRADAAYMRVLQNAHFLHAHADTEGWLTLALLTNNVYGHSRYGLLAALVTMGYLERGERGRLYRLTEQGRAFRSHLFTPAEFEALIYFARFSLADPEAYIPRPAGRSTRLATNRAFDLQRPPVIARSTVAALVRRDLLEAAPDGLDAYRATRLSRPLLAMRAPSAPKDVEQLTEKDREYLYRAIAGLVEVRRNRLGVYVGLYDGPQTDMDCDAGRWIVICETHGQLVNTGQKSTALYLMAHTGEFCDGCRELLNNGQRNAKLPQSLASVLASRAPVGPTGPEQPDGPEHKQDDWEEIAEIDEARRRDWNEQWYDAQAPYL